MSGTLVMSVKAVVPNLQGMDRSLGCKKNKPKYNDMTLQRLL